MFYKKIQINDTEYLLAVNISGSGKPTEATDASVGMFYMDEDNGKVHKCVAPGVWEDIVDITNVIDENSADKCPTASAVKNYTNNIFANALKGSAKSEGTLAITDTSPIEHNMGLGVESKNLFDPSVFEIAGVTKENGYYKTTAATLYNYYHASKGRSLYNEFQPNTQYVFSWKGKNSTKEDRTVGFYFAYSDGFTVDYVGSTTETTLTIVSDPTKTVVGLHASMREEDSSGIYLKDFQLEIGKTKTEYAPPVDLAKVIVTREEDGKAFVFNENGDVTDRSGNLLTTVTTSEIINNSGSIDAEEGGNTVTITSLDTGVEGNANISITNPISLKAGATYHFKVEGVANEGVAFVLWDGEEGYELPFNEDYIYTPSADTNVSIEVKVFEGGVFGESGTTYSLSCIAKGDTIVNSLYPNNTFTSNEKGVIILADYNRDINKAFASLEEKIVALSALSL